jgi:adenosine deaminase
VSNCTTSLDYRRLCTCRRRYRKLRHVEERCRRSIRPARGSLEDMLLCFEFFLPLVYDNLELLEYLAFDFVRRQHEQNVVYTEVRYSPQLLASDPRLAHQAITKGLRRGCQEFSDQIVNQLLCGINFYPDWASDVVDMAVEFRNDFPCAVVGIDIAAGEDHFSSDSPFHGAHKTMCQRAVQHGIPITLHAGEVPESKHNVPRAILDYGAIRIGHGYAIAGDIEIMNLVKTKNVHIESCPTSSVETGGWINHTTKTDWKDHPACILRNHGVKVSLSSDDPAVFNTSLTWQWRIALKSMVWSKDDVIRIMYDAMDAAFAPDHQKDFLRQRIDMQTKHVTSLCERSPTKELERNQDFRDRVHYDTTEENVIGMARPVKK